MSEDKPISYQPTAGLSYDPGEPLYWDAKALAGELERVFEVCHGCRMCFKYCDTFPGLFSLIDSTHGGDVSKLEAGEVRQVLDTCFQCKLCDVQCPYTPRDNHPYQLDFPRLVHRYRAVEARRSGRRLRDRILGDPDLAGTLARLSLGLANLANRLRPNRWILEKLLGIHRDKLLPEFARESFEGWAERTGRIKDRAGGEAVLFQTCYVQHNEPRIGRDTVEVMERNRVDLRCVKGLRCCGMPAWEKGDLDTLRAAAHHNLGVLLPYVERGAKVAVINPTCSMMLRREYPHLVAPEDREAAAKVAAATLDVSELLWSIRDEPRFDARFLSGPQGKVAYHAPCHLRAQAVGFRGRDLLRKVPGTQPAMVMECCGHNGTYAMTCEGFAPSRRIGEKAFTGMRDTGAKVWVSDCPLAAIQFEQHAGTRPLHPMSFLARAYREDGFESKLEPPAAATQREAQR